MKATITDAQIHELQKNIEKLSVMQFERVNEMTNQFMRPIEIYVNEEDGLYTYEWGRVFGDYLRIHHCLSKDAFAKDKFEYAMQQSFADVGVEAVLAVKDNPGEDITIAWDRFSLKTQAEKTTKRDSIHISKYMEMGKGQWKTVDDLPGLRDRFLDHLTHYERIVILRCLLRGPIDWEYELVEIPKGLLQEARNGTFEMSNGSKQNPKPGNCYVYDDDGKLKFKLYFDGGSEKKLQIQSLDKGLCTVQATWSFSIK